MGFRLFSLVLGCLGFVLVVFFGLTVNHSNHNGGTTMTKPKRFDVRLMEAAKSLEKAGPFTKRQLQTAAKASSNATWKWFTKGLAEGVIMEMGLIPTNGRPSMTYALTGRIPEPLPPDVVRVVAYRVVGDDTLWPTAGLARDHATAIKGDG